MQEPKWITTKVIHRKGTIGDMGQEYMIEQDWEDHRKYVEELKEKGEYLQPEELTITMIDDGFDKPEKALSSYKFVIEDLSND